MKRILLVLFFTVPLLADVPQLVGEGVRLYDAGRYDEAIAKFKEALAEDPSSEIAAYELALAYSAKGDNLECQAVLEPLVRKKGKYQAAMYAILGNCYDHGGDPQRAIATYRKGLRIDRNDTQLLYNLAVTLAGKGELDEARKLLKKELGINPRHASGHFLLAKVFDAQNFRIPATLSYLRFLALEPTGDRAREAAARVLELLNAGVEVKDKNNITLTIDSQPRKEEGDYGAVEMMMAIAGGARFLPENENKSEFERSRAQVSSTLAMVAEVPNAGRDYTAKQVVPYFRTLYERKLLDTYAGIALMSLGLPGMEEWAKANETAVERYLAFMREQR